MAIQNNASDRGDSNINVSDSAQPGIKNAAAEAYTGSATMAGNASDTSQAYLPSFTIAANQTNDTQTVSNFEQAGNTFNNLTSDFSTALQDLSSGSPNGVSDLATLYGHMYQADGQLSNASNSESSTFSNDSQLASGVSDIHNDLSGDENNVMQALKYAATGDTNDALTTLTNAFGHFSSDTQQDASEVGNLAQIDYNGLYGLNDGTGGTTAGGGGTDSSAGGTTAGGGGTDSSAGGTTAAGGTDSSAGGTTAAGGTDSSAGGTTAAGGTDSSAGGTTAAGGTDSSAGGTTAAGGTDSSAGGTAAAGGTDSSAGGTAAAGGTDSSAGGTAGDTASSGSTLPAYLNANLNAQEQAGLNEVNTQHPGEAQSESHLNNAYSDGQTALSMLQDGGATNAQISKAINEAANNTRAARTGFYDSLTNNGIARHKGNPDDPINQGLNQFPSANQEFMAAQEDLKFGDKQAAAVAVTNALQDISNGNNGVLTGLGQELGVSAS